MIENSSNINYKIEQNNVWWEIIDILFLNDKKDVIELITQTNSMINFKNGQFLTFALNDKDWLFFRSYSVAKIIWNKIHFIIKILENWRAWKIFKNLQIWDNIKAIGPFWVFTIKDKSKNKIFIWTGTWLCPLYNMLLSIPNNIKVKLYYWLQKNEDLYYIEKLKEFENLEVNLYLSQEENIYQKDSNINYIKWRINSNTLLKEDKNNEFYICWNPNMVEEVSKLLINNNFKYIYSEKF